MDITVDVRSELQKAREVLTSPKAFFKSSTKEKSWKSAFSFALVMSAVGHILTAVYSLIFSQTLASNVSETFGVSDFNYGPVQIIIGVFISFILTIGMTFIWGGGLKVWLSLFKIDSSFSEAYKVMVYSRTPNYLLSWFPGVNLISALYSFYLLMLALESEFGITRRKAIVIILSSVAILIAISLLSLSFLPAI